MQSGALPNSWLSWVACELKMVDFSFNNLQGNISANISKIEKLQILALGYNSEPLAT